MPRLWWLWPGNWHHCLSWSRTLVFAAVVVVNQKECDDVGIPVALFDWYVEARGLRAPLVAPMVDLPASCQSRKQTAGRISSSQKRKSPQAFVDFPWPLWCTWMQIKPLWRSCILISSDVVIMLPVFRISMGSWFRMWLLLCTISSTFANSAGSCGYATCKNMPLYQCSLDLCSSETMHTKSLSLPSENLTGTIPPGLGSLTFLTNLYVPCRRCLHFGVCHSLGRPRCGWGSRTPRSICFAFFFFFFFQLVGTE